MKLPSEEACLLAFSRGNQKEKTLMGETRMEGLSDRGSIPLRSTQSSIGRTPERFGQEGSGFTADKTLCIRIYLKAAYAQGFLVTLWHQEDYTQGIPHTL